ASSPPCSSPPWRRSGPPGHRSWPARGGGPRPATCSTAPATPSPPAAGRSWRAPRAGPRPSARASGARDRQLAAQANRALRPFEGVEGGYFVRDYKRFLGAAFPTGPMPPPKEKQAARRPGPPPREADLIEIQVDAAIRKDQRLFVIEEVQPAGTIAIRTAPVAVDGTIVAATWTMTRLVDPLFLDRSLRGYRLAAGLALGGIVLALILTAGLARTVRNQAIERDRLQTELRRSERLAALGKLLAGVAHEVRNPLAGIRSTVQLWQRGIGPDAESFADLLAEVDRVEEIVARLLHFSRADAQELVPGDLNAVVGEVARLTRGPADAQGVDLELDLDPALPTVAMAPPALVQVLRNLTTNALQAMPDGGTLRLATRHDPARGAVEASVADTGPGLPPDVLAHLFEPFYTTKAGGTGLGLAIAREIALAHRGELRARSRPGKPGAVFTLALPVADGDSDPDEGGHADGRA
ncbi:MAG: two-component system sensor histidine kinase NtrB, partial [Planctomycetaceae bacterium]